MAEASAGEPTRTPSRGKPMIITPFQIFCYQAREPTARLNPHLRGTGITHVLSRMWRSLDPATREHFVELSFQLRSNQEERIAAPSHQPDPIGITTSRAVPMLAIVAHKSFGCFAAEISQNLMSSSSPSNQS
jgi:hypothetical protein